MERKNCFDNEVLTSIFRADMHIRPTNFKEGLLPHLEGRNPFGAIFM